MVPEKIPHPDIPGLFILGTIEPPEPMVPAAAILSAHGVPETLGSWTECKRGHPRTPGVRCRECDRMRRRVEAEVLRQRYEARRPVVYEPPLEALVEEQEKDARWGDRVHAQGMTRPDGWGEDGDGWDRAITEGGRY